MLSALKHERNVYEHAFGVSLPEPIGRTFLKIPQQQPNQMRLLSNRRFVDAFEHELAMRPANG